MPLFPVFLDLSGRRCLVVGGGPVGCAKAAALTAAGARVVLLDPSPSAPAHSLPSTARLLVEARGFTAEDCNGCVLVFACTGDEAVNSEVARSAAAAGVLCCRSDGGDSDFSTGALLRRGEFCVAASSGGTSPVLAVAARDRIAETIGEEFGVAARMLGELREQLRKAVPDTAARAATLRAAPVEQVLGALREGRDEEARALLRTEFGAAERAGEEGSCTR
ncbi:MAG: bifunctional precorrin-2 dehydrogenase/sirohydrochlorin ferrochelatase [Candidatus Binatia bacterium]